MSGIMEGCFLYWQPMIQCMLASSVISQLVETPLLPGLHRPQNVVPDPPSLKGFIRSYSEVYTCQLVIILRDASAPHGLYHSVLACDLYWKAWVLCRQAYRMALLRLPLGLCELEYMGTNWTALLRFAIVLGIVYSIS